MQTTERKYEFGQKTHQRQDASYASSNSGTVPDIAMHAASSGPVKSFRSGALQVAIWENESLTQEGQVSSFRTVSFERRYKDKSGEWKSSNSLRINDLPKAALLLAKAYEYLVLTGEHDEVTI
jgi:hypothetical protein